MTISDIKEELNNHIGEKITINYNLGRNKKEEYRVVIKQLYNNIFIVKLENNEEIKSFSYSDVISKTVQIHY